ncbi:cysteine--tRNA ligase [Candidatus Babela massiliensis]|uniref:Cysteine--tRNA ligase n=1 Tax=Candidatus Babela massiliensis TaxID=673862 RepID=V6DHC2_9BACT|nr:cysteine--tRNA ligase [Candidatus Babela massiliensis]CDK30944.1 Cysteinyl-tRNA synthetase [Candidatus Babela massiliensis]
MNNFKLYLTNTLSGNQELFEPNSVNQKNQIDSDKKLKVNMYVCGITPYDYAHLGHGRCYVTFDLLYRLLNLLDYKVTYCRNFTDIDDKLIKRSELEFSDPNQYWVLSSKFIKAYHEDMAKLNCLSPQYEPYVTKHIPQIINFIEQLINKNKAYNSNLSNGDVYYNVNSFKDYGKLSKRDLSELKIGARVEVREDKKSPLDFALWKGEESGPGWNSPWGFGRPGWHIECSTLIKEYLGDSIDIHGGGMDLIFPHHENEIAQSEALTDRPLAKYWIHNAFILVNKEKMSKSLGNFFTLRELFEKYDPMLIRYYFLNHHYRSPIEFSIDDLKASSKSYQRLVKFFEGVEVEDLTSIKEEDFNKLTISLDLLNALLSDLNVAKFFGIIFEKLKELEQNKAEIIMAKSLIQQILGLKLEPILEEKVEITPAIQELINQREHARSLKDWKKADEIRDKLVELGVEVQDKKLNK